MVAKDGSRKCLRLLNGDEYGFTEGDTVHINIQKLWAASNGDFSGFTSGFALTFVHETLHILIDGEICKANPLLEVSLIAEEKIVRKLTNENWNKKLEKHYTEDEEDEKDEN